MLLAFDIGNTNIVVSTCENGAWSRPYRFRTDSSRSSDEYLFMVGRMLDGRKPQSCVISSVVPNLTRAFTKIARSLSGKEPVVISVKSRTSLKNIPQELGSDILSNLEAAHNRYPDDYVTVLDFGTAFTTSTVAPDGKVMGVTISPGLVTSVNALSNNTAQLPQIELRFPETVLGLNTESSILAGIMYGFAGQARELVARIRQELGKTTKVLATGGLSSTIQPLIPEIDQQDVLLTLDGMRLIHDKTIKGEIRT